MGPFFGGQFFGGGFFKHLSSGGSGGGRKQGLDPVISFQLALLRQQIEERAQVKKQTPLPQEVKGEVKRVAENVAQTTADDDGWVDVEELFAALAKGTKTLARRLSILDQIEAKLIALAERKRLQEIEDEEDEEEAIVMLLMH